MRRFAKMIPQEISLTQEGANRRVIATYKSRSKPGEEEVAKGGPGSGPTKGEGGGDSRDKRNAADAATDKAKSSRDSADHSKAAELHRSAAKAFSKEGNSLASENHADIARLHDEAAVTFKKSSGRTAMNIQEAIENTPEAIVEQLHAVTKSATASGKGYTPQAASVMKAVGRMLAPFSDELSLDDLKTIGQAAGFEGCDQSVSKSVGKGKDEEDDTEAGSADQGRAMDFNADDDEEEEEDEDADEEMVESSDPDAEEDEPTKPVKKSVLAENVALKAKKDDTGADDEAESEPSGEDSADEEDDIKPANAKAWGQPKGTKAKGETVAKSAMTGSSASEEHYSEIRKSLERQRLENEHLKEAIAKTRADLDEERSFRALENIKKSVKADYSHLNVDVESLAPVLKSLKEAKDSALYEQLTATLKAADAQVKAAQEAGGLFQAVGKSSARTAAAGAGATWSDKIDLRVEEEFKKNAKGRVKAQVYDQFVESDEGREMLANHRAEMAQTRGF